MMDDDDVIMVDRETGSEEGPAGRGGRANSIQLPDEERLTVELTETLTEVSTNPVSFLLLRGVLTTERTRSQGRGKG